MRFITAEATRTIYAPAAAVYEVLVDYRSGHPRILPERYFSDLVVEQGGRGAGTVIRFQMHMLGSTRTALAHVDEPEPGRVLTEKYPENGAVTTFQVLPLDDGRRARVTITTQWSSPGPRGLMERWIVPPLLRKIFREELANLEVYVQRPAVPAPQEHKR
jgi:hypothetical protein